MKTLNNEKYLEATDIKDLLGVNIDTARRYLRTGKIKSIKLGKSYYVKEKDFKQMFDNLSK